MKILVSLKLRCTCVYQLSSACVPMADRLMIQLNRGLLSERMFSCDNVAQWFIVLICVLTKSLA